MMAAKATTTATIDMNHQLQIHPFHRCHNHRSFTSSSSSLKHKLTMMLLLIPIAVVVFYIQDCSFFISSSSSSATTQKKKTKAVVQFVSPFSQHNNNNNNNQLGYYAEECVWKAFSNSTTTTTSNNNNSSSSDDNDLLLRNLLFGSTTTIATKTTDDENGDDDSNTILESLDDIQNAALKDTICLPTSSSSLNFDGGSDSTNSNSTNNNETTASNNLHNHNNLPHIFSTQQARECLSSSDNVHLLITGDSYMKQLYIGLGDILLGRVSNQNYLGAGVRMKAVEKTQSALVEAGINHIKYGCRKECYGELSTFVDNCTSCIQNYYERYTANNNDHHQPQVIPIVGSAIHIYDRFNYDVDKTVKELIDFISKMMQSQQIPMIFVTPQYYQLSKVPPTYRLKNWQANEIYTKLLIELNTTTANNNNTSNSSSSSSQQQQQFCLLLDVYQLTKSCKFDNCTNDGGHRSRFVNRWKAQLLLNMICKLS